MKRFLIFLLILLLLCPWAQAAQSPDLQSLMADFMAQRSLNKENFSLSYYNTVTGESYIFNDDAFMVAGSTFKLPLNMYYYELEQAGEIASDAYIPRAGTTLDTAHRLSMVDSNNEVSIGMLYHLGDFRTYKTLMRKYFSMTDEEIDYIYFADNYYCTRMMMDALKYLYEHSEDFGELLGYMKQAQQTEYFCAGVTEYPVAHKYGWFEGAVNDVGIIYTDEPFLLAVYTQGVYGEQVLADAAALLAEYNVTQANLPPAEDPNAVTLQVEMVPVPEEESPVEEAAPPAEPQAEPVLTQEEDASLSPWLILCCLPLAAAGLWLLLRRKKP